MSVLDSVELTNRVVDSFHGIVPILGGKVDLHTIIRRVLDVLSDEDIIDLEAFGEGQEQ